MDITALLNDTDARARLRQEVATFLGTDKYRGLMIDFETFSRKGQAGYLTLLQELSDDLHAKGMKLYVSVQARNTDYNYAATAAHVDGVVLMNYDEHYPAPGLAGPVASQDWFTDNLKAAVKVIPKEKLISAIGNYGYDWVKRPKHGSLPPGVKDINVSVQDAWLTARDSEADVDFDGDSLNPHVSYLDEHNLQHDIWFLDAVTALNEMRAAQALGIKTFALWRLGSEDRSLWRVWDVPGEAGAEEKLKDVPPGQDVDMEGEGEILRIEARPANGQRSITLDQATGLITDQNLDSAARALPGGALRIQPGQGRHHFRRWPGSGMDTKNPGCAQARPGARGIFPDRHSGRQVFRRDQAHLPRGTRNREPHLYPSRHQQYLPRFHAGG